jgi:hypothetical protein
MKLAQFILNNIEPILTEWEAFAKSLPPGKNMNTAALRNDADRMLRFVAADMETAQSEDQRAAKGLGQHTLVSSAAHGHGGLRHMQAFDLIQMVSEFRALRASVIRLYSAEAGTALPATSSELIRFNESIDQILAGSVHRYAGEVEQSARTVAGRARTRPSPATVIDTDVG